MTNDHSTRLRRWLLVHRDPEGETFERPEGDAYVEAKSRTSRSDPHPVEVRPGWETEVASLLAGHREVLYVSACPVGRPLHRRHDATDVAALEALWLDVDDAGGGEAALDVLLGHAPPASVVARTPNGWQPWWHLDAPLRDLTEATALVEDWTRWLGGIAGDGLKVDHTGDLARLMRLPVPGGAAGWRSIHLNRRYPIEALRGRIGRTLAEPIERGRRPEGTRPPAKRDRSTQATSDPPTPAELAQADAVAEALAAADPNGFGAVWRRAVHEGDESSRDLALCNYLALSGVEDRTALAVWWRFRDGAREGAEARLKRSRDYWRRTWAKASDERPAPRRLARPTTSPSSDEASPPEGEARVPTIDPSRPRRTTAARARLRDAGLRIVTAPEDNRLGALRRWARWAGKDVAQGDVDEALYFEQLERSARHAGIGEAEARKVLAVALRRARQIAAVAPDPAVEVERSGEVDELAWAFGDALREVTWDEATKRYVLAWAGGDVAELTVRQALQNALTRRRVHESTGRTVPAVRPRQWDEVVAALARRAGRGQEETA